MIWIKVTLEADDRFCAAVMEDDFLITEMHCTGMTVLNGCAVLEEVHRGRTAVRNFHHIAHVTLQLMGYAVRLRNGDYTVDGTRLVRKGANCSNCTRPTDCLYPPDFLSQCFVCIHHTPKACGNCRWYGPGCANRNDDPRLGSCGEWEAKEGAQ